MGSVWNDRKVQNNTTKELRISRLGVRIPPGTRICPASQQSLPHFRRRAGFARMRGCVSAKLNDTARLLDDLFVRCVVDRQVSLLIGDLKPDSRERLCSWQNSSKIQNEIVHRKSLL